MPTANRSALSQFRLATEHLRQDIARSQGSEGRTMQPYTTESAIEQALMQTFVYLGHGTTETQGAVAAFINVLARIT